MKERIRLVRRTLDLTQQEFADRIGIKRGAIANYELGRNEPVDSVVSLICREYKVNEEWLRTGTGDMFLPDNSNELSALVDRYSLTENDRVFIEKYVNLKPGSRDAIMNFILDVASALSDPECEKPSSSAGLDIDAEVEEYRRQLELQKKAGGEFSAFCTSNEKGENKKEA